MDNDSIKNLTRILYREHLNIKYNFNLSQNSKAFFINNPKIGSRYLTDALNKDTTRFTINLPNTDLVPYEGGYSDLKYLQDISMDWNNILN